MPFFLLNLINEGTDQESEMASSLAGNRYEVEDDTTKTSERRLLET